MSSFVLLFPCAEKWVHLRAKLALPRGKVEQVEMLFGDVKVKIPFYVLQYLMVFWFGLQ
jgi:hypothetical protein